MQTLIIGGGLSGLALAEHLEEQSHDYFLVEARDRFGGRIKTVTLDGGTYDIGPAWFWPGQPRIAALIDRLGLEKFDQFSEGLLSFEDEQGNVQRGRGFASMEGSWRLKAGLAHLTQTLSDRLPDMRKRLNAPVTALSKTSDGVTATFEGGEMVTASQVVFALPPRVAAEFTIEPALPASAIRSMQSIATWMAGQAKVVAVYDSPFWRAAGLSGDAMSRTGPMSEIHDASPAEGGPYALFGFIGISPQHRGDEQALRQQILGQFVRLFGAEAAKPTKLFLKDWAFDPRTSTDADRIPLYEHPSYGLPGAMVDLWDGDLLFAGTEVAPQFGGYLEGALEAADNVVRTIGHNRMDRARTRL